MQKVTAVSKLKKSNRYYSFVFYTAGVSSLFKKGAPEVKSTTIVETKTKEATSATSEAVIGWFKSKLGF